MMRILTLALIIAGLVFSGCGGSKRAVKEAEPAEPTEAINMAEYEDFDAAPYTDRPRPEAVEVEHEVPEVLLNPRSTAPARRTVRVYRLQVFSTNNKPEADAQVGAIIEWWQSQKGTANVPGLFTGSNAPVYTIYRQPYYRIRLGNFTSRAQAERALAAVGSRFPGAMIVQDSVSR